MKKILIILALLAVAASPLLAQSTNMYVPEKVVHADGRTEYRWSELDFPAPETASTAAGITNDYDVAPEVQGVPLITGPEVSANETDPSAGPVAAAATTTNGLQDTSIGNLETATNSLQSQVSANDDDITALNAATNGLQSQITDNDSDISALQTATNGLQSQVSQNVDDIDVLEGQTNLYPRLAEDNDFSASNHFSGPLTLAQ